MMNPTPPEKLSGALSVSASAGTGKTWTVAQLALRLVAEQGVPVERMLITTFTNAATAEMAGRIRDRLQAAYDFLVALGDEAPVREQDEALAGETAIPWSDWAILAADRAQAQLRLRRALGDFDLSFISTIHGFCSRMLARFSFELGLEDGGELGGLPGEMVKRAAVDAVLSGNAAGGLWKMEDLAWKVAVLGKDEIPADGKTDEVEAQMRQLAGSLDFPQDAAGVAADIKAKTRSTAKLAAAAEYAIAVAASSAAPWSVQCPLTEPQMRALSDWNPDFETLEKLREKREKIAFVRAAHHLRNHILAAKAAQSFRTHDDLLKVLCDALAAEAQGGSLRPLHDRIQGDFDAVIVDEFQDTDPVQAKIFQSLFLEGWEKERSRVFILVGDPKQSIYRFRGADLGSYQELKKKTVTLAALDQNRRTDKGLIDALNAVYAAHPSPFPGLEEKAQVVATHPGSRLLSTHGAKGGKPLEVWWVAATEKNKDGSPKALAKNAVRFLLLRQMANHIAASLARNDRVKEGDVRRPLRPSDIAVLASKNDTLDGMRSLLRERGIAVAQKSRVSVLATPEAQDWRLWLGAMVAAGAREPDAAAKVRAGWLSNFYGKTAVEAAMAPEPALLQGLDLAMRQAEELSRNGPLALLHAHALGRAQVLAEADAFAGQVTLSRWRHVGELLNQAWVEGGRSDPEQLLRWFEIALAETGGRDEKDTPESEQLRQESESDGVVLTTIHASKGLEYGVVYLPDLWEKEPWKTEVPFVVREDGKTVLETGTDRCEERKEAIRSAEDEEGSRFLYVALTRAKHKVVAALPQVAASKKSWIARLLLQDAADDFSKWPEAMKGLDAHGIATREIPMAVLGRREALAPLPQPHGHSEGLASAASLEVQILEDPLPVSDCPRAQRTVSFSLLSKSPMRAENTPSRPVLAREDGGDVPAPFARVAEPEFVPAALAPGALLSRLKAKGTGVGHMVHETMERVLALPVADRAAALPDILARKAAIHCRATPAEEIAATAEDLGKLLSQAIGLPDGVAPLRLSELPPLQLQAEMNFTLPAKKERFTAEALADAFAAGDSDDAIKSYARELTRLSWGALRGHLTGVMDLVFTHEGRWFVLDWKTNAGVGDGSPAALWEEMTTHHYPLQAALYTVALHRLLKARLADYDPKNHLGGAAYLFLRAMRPEDASGAPGVWAHRFPVEAVDAMDALFDAREEGGRR